MIPEHLQPQYSRASLTAWTDMNYQKAINFYNSRLRSFETRLGQDLGMASGSLLANINSEIEKKWKGYVLGKFWSLVKIIRAGGNVTAEIQKLKASSKYEEYFTGETVGQFLEQYKKGKGGNPVSLLGYRYEEFVNAMIAGALAGGANLTTNKMNQIIKDLAQYITTTGEKTSKSVAIAKEGFIRPDIILSLGNKQDFEKINGVLYKNGIEVELQEEIKLNDISNEDLSSLMTVYNAAGLYGFSVKLWSWSNNKKFMSSAPLRDELKSEFEQTDSQGMQHTWELDYITTYMLWKVSNNMLNFMGPTDIGLITGKGFEGFDSWLGDHMFYMKVQVDNIVKSNSTYNVKPHIEDSGVYILDFIHHQQAIKAKIQKSKNGNMGQLRIVAKNDL